MNLLLITVLLSIWAASRDVPNILQKVSTILDREWWDKVSNTRSVSMEMPKDFWEYQRLKSEGSTDAANDIARMMRVRDLFVIFPDVDKEFGQTEGKARDGKLEQLRSSLRQLQQVFYNTDLGSEATVQELVRAVEHSGKLKLPLIEETVSFGVGVMALAFGQSLILLYLISLSLAIQEWIVTNTGGVDTSWIFFHPGELGMGLGAMWALSPLLGQCYFFLSHKEVVSDWVSIGIAVFLALFTGLAAAYVIHVNWRVNRMLKKRRTTVLQRNQVQQPSSVVAEPDP